MDLIKDLQNHLNDLNAKWYLCGGYAVDAYLEKKTRRHKDIDITMHYSALDTIVSYLKSREWTILAPVGNKQLVPVKYALNNPDLKIKNIWCFKQGADFIKEIESDGIYRHLEYDRDEQTELDFIEVIFNSFDKDGFYFKGDPNLVRCIDKVFLNKGEIEILAPEIVLLHKASNPTQEDNRQDYQEILKSLCGERLEWLMVALKGLYPEGHPWILKNADHVASK